MKTIYVLLLVLCALVVCVPSQAAVRYNFNFDTGIYVPSMTPQYQDMAPHNTVTDPSYYKPTGAEVSDPNVWGEVLAPGGWPEYGHETGILVASTGPQGGKAFKENMSAAWPNHQGLYFGRDYVTHETAEGSFYGDHTYPGMTDPYPGSAAGGTITNNFTIEALVNPDFSGDPFGWFGLSTRSTIYDSVRYDSVAGGASLWVDQNNGNVGFSWGNSGSEMIVTAGLQAGTWYHIAAVAQSGVGMSLYVNGSLLGTAAYPTDGTILPGYFTLGTNYWAGSAGKNWQGLMDAVAISDTALAPSNFALSSSQVPEPSAVLTLAAGLLGLCGRVRPRIRK